MPSTVEVNVMTPSCATWVTPGGGVKVGAAGSAVAGSAVAEGAGVDFAGGDGVKTGVSVAVDRLAGGATNSGRLPTTQYGPGQLAGTLVSSGSLSLSSPPPMRIVSPRRTVTC